MNDIDTWNIEKSRLLYGIDNWGADYFGINSTGNITVSPDGPEGASIDLAELVRSVQARDIELPVLFRFNGILRHRIHRIRQAFLDAIKDHEYQGSYFPAYPIKVNQQRQLVDVIRTFGSDFSMSLEVGSKPELIAVLGVHDSGEGLLLCNGYKDRDYIEMALMAQKLGRRPIVVIEKPSELQLVLDVAQKLGVRPELGFRLRLAGKGAGRWEKSGGDRAKFGLSAGELISSLNELERREQLDLVRLLHFHIGSQITAISSLRNALKESAQVYVQLRRLCPNLTFFDVGGGLGVDYDGSKTNFSSSMNYTVDEYARDIIWILEETCRNGDVPHPDIVTECGRATVAHQSVLVFDVLGIANCFTRQCDAAGVIEQSEQTTIRSMAQLLLDLTPKNCQETLHDVLGLRSDMLQQFNLGLMSIEDRALGDDCFWAVLNAIGKASRELHYLPEDLEALPEMLTDTYFCNLSVFQSLPDNWAIQHIFPITPVHRLNEEPTRRVVLADITCDSDGKVDRFADLRDVKHYLPAHELRGDEPYYLATFLVGAYQEILGDLHNLFGDTNAVHIELNGAGQAELANVILGDSVREVLRYVQYDREELCERWRNALERAVSEGTISATESGEMYKKYSRSFQGYTYLIGGDR